MNAKDLALITAAAEEHYRASGLIGGELYAAINEAKFELSHHDVEVKPVAPYTSIGHTHPEPNIAGGFYGSDGAHIPHNDGNA